MAHKVLRHMVKKTIEEMIYYPEHDKRHETETYRKNREKLVSQHGCYICNTTKNLEAHHYGCEWAEWHNADPKKLREFLLTFDVYGLSHKISAPLTSVDDIRNLMILCSKHHRHKLYGIHHMTFPYWIMQKIKKEDVKLIPKK